MDIRVLRNDSDYDWTLSRLNALFDAPTGTSEGDEAEILAILVDEYERKHHPIEAPDPIEAIKIRMEELGLGQVDLLMK